MSNFQKAALAPHKAAMVLPNFIGGNEEKEKILARVGQWTLRRYDYPNAPQIAPTYSFGTDCQYNNRTYGVGENQYGSCEDVMDILRSWTILDTSGEARKMEDTFLSVLTRESVRNIPKNALFYSRLEDIVFHLKIRLRRRRISRG